MPGGPHRRLHGAREILGALRERAEHVPGRVHDRDDVLAWHEQHVTGEERPGVQERDEVVVLEHEVRGNLARDDPAEDAAVRHQATTSYSGARPRIPVAAMTSTARRQ